MDKGAIHVLFGMEEDGPDFIPLLRIVGNVKQIYCLFREFSIEYLSCKWPRLTETMDREISSKRGLLQGCVHIDLCRWSSLVFFAE